MCIIFIAVIALAVPPAHVDTSATPTTRLFVRTAPLGAAVTVDGKMIGKSDGLFAVPAGAHRISVELHGYVAETREIQVHAGRITRLEIRP